MDWKTLKQAAREKFNGACRVCPVCNGVACAGEMPGMGGIGTGASFQNNVAALAGYRLNLKVVHDVSEPVMACRILGMDLLMPIIGAAIAGGKLNMGGATTEPEYAAAVVNGCHEAGTVGMTGDGPIADVFEAGLKAIGAVGGRGIPVIKPRENDKIIEKANQAAAAGAVAFGMDIDAAAIINMTNAGQPVGPKTAAELAFIKKNTKIPFIVKGIMVPEDARACVEAGVDAIVVSNHGGRVLDHTPGTAEVLPYIAEAVRGKITILVDGGIRSGADVLKMLALGADAVLVGRPVTIGGVGAGAEGVAMVLNKMAAELRAAMVLTGTANVAEVPEDILW